MSDDTERSTAPVSTIVVNAPVLVFGGCYSNLQATRALLLEARRIDVVLERMICTGDVIAYDADPRATLALIRDAGIATLMGNCEEALAASAEDCGCGFAPGSACDRLSAAWFAYASREVDAADRGWMAGLPRRIDLLFGGRRVAVVHGAPSQINRFIFASTADHEVVDEIALSEADGVIEGIAACHSPARSARCYGTTAGRSGCLPMMVRHVAGIACWYPVLMASRSVICHSLRSCRRIAGHSFGRLATGLCGDNRERHLAEL